MSASETLFRVAALNTRYAAAIDADRLEEWPGFFVADCLYKITTAENLRKGYEAGVIYADSRAMLEDRISALRRANIYERQSYRHIIGMPSVMSEEAGVIRVANAGTSKRKYATLSIPESVALRVHERLGNQPFQATLTGGHPLRIIRLGDLHAGVSKKPRNVIKLKPSQQLAYGECVT